MKSAFERLISLWIGRWAKPDPAAKEAVKDLAPATIVIGGSEGIGLAFARLLAGRGMTVLLVGRSQEKLDQAVRQLTLAGATRIETLALDVATTDAGDAISRRLEQQGLYADLVINCAGIGLHGKFCTHPERDLAELTDLNVRALTLLTRHFLPQMLARGQGGILNVASLGGFAPGPGEAAYYASKAYVISLTLALAHEVRGRGVRVAVTAPGPVATGFHAKMGAERAWYRRLIPPLSPNLVARVSLFWFALGRRLILMHPLDMVLAWLMRALPWTLIVPIVSVLLSGGRVPPSDLRRRPDPS